jgi:1-aminocyclopropane-1-carboxylate deaminase/D-cysteine desulfhydrase-like pyridoxal-dependent ACC family enzyme
LSIDYALKQQIPVIAVTKKTYGPLRPNAQKALELLQHSEVIFDLDPFQRAENIHKTTSNSFLMPLGGFHQEAAKTSLSLGYEIGDFHKQTPLKRVFLDAGTGLQAACALLALQEIGFQGEAYIVMMGPLDFYKVMQQVSEWVELPLPSFKIHPVYPLTARSYGKTNKTLQDFRKEFFEKEKIVLDDVYNAKLFHTALSYIRDLKLEGPYLIVHSGGTYSGTISE